MYKSSARISLHLLPGFEFLKIKSVLYDTDNTPKNVTVSVSVGTHKYENISVTEVGEEYGRYDERESHRDSHS